MEMRALCSEPFFSFFLYAKVNWEIENGHFKMSIFDLLKILCPKHFFCILQLEDNNLFVYTLEY